MSTIQRVKWDDWRGGDLGHLSAFEAGRRQPFRYESRNLLFDSRQNALVYRPGAARLLTVPSTTGFTCIGMGWVQVSTKELWFVLRNDSTGTTDLYLTNTLTGATTLVASPGVVAAGVAVVGVEHPPGLSYLTFPGLGLFKLDHAASTLTIQDTTLGGHSITVYGDRLYIGGNLSGVKNRIRFSAALNFASFPANNFFDVGPGQAVRFIVHQRGHLTIALEDGTWWVLNGLPNSGGSLRRVASSAMQPWEFFPPAATIRGDDVVTFVPLPHDYPATFDGASVDLQDELSIDDNDISQPGAGPTRYVVQPLNDPDETIFRSGLTPAKVLLDRRGAWTRHEFGFAQGQPYMASDRQSWVYLAGKNGSDFAVYRFNYGHIRPGQSTTSTTEPLTDEGASAHQGRLVLPEWWHPDGADVTVRSVTVEAFGWGATRSAPTISCSARSVGRIEAGFSESAVVTKAPAAFDGVRSFTFPLGEHGAGRGFQVRLSNITFLSILRVIADVSVDPPRQGR